MSETFRPNDMLKNPGMDLEPWQALVAACHFGPTMGDCVELDYRYRIDNGSIYLVGSGPGGTDVCLDGDIDLRSPLECLKQYAGLEGWQEIAESKVLQNIADYHGDD